MSKLKVILDAVKGHPDVARYFCSSQYSRASPQTWNVSVFLTPKIRPCEAMHLQEILESIAPWLQPSQSFVMQQHGDMIELGRRLYTEKIGKRTVTVDDTVGLYEHDLLDIPGFEEPSDEKKITTADITMITLLSVYPNEQYAMDVLRQQTESPFFVPRHEFLQQAGYLM